MCRLTSEPHSMVTRIAIEKRRTDRHRGVPACDAWRGEARYFRWTAV